MKPVLLLFLCGMLLICVPAAAQNCNAILKYGIWDTYSSNSNLAQSRAFSNWLCSAEKNGGNTSLGISAEGYGSLSFGKSSNSEQQLCRSSASGTSLTKSGSTFASQASKVIADAWSNCMNSLGGHASVVYHDDSRLFSITLQYVGPKSNHADVSLGVTPLHPGRASCAPAKAIMATKPGASVSFDRTATFNCRRNSGQEPVLVSVNFLGGGGSDVLTIPTLPLDPPADRVWCLPLKGNTSIPYNNGWDVSSGDKCTCRKVHVEPLGQSLPAGTLFRFEILCRGTTDPNRTLVNPIANDDNPPAGYRLPTTFDPTPRC
jgi:hypothetical protein